MSIKKWNRIMIFGPIMILGVIMCVLIGYQTITNAQSGNPSPEVRFTPGPPRIIELDDPEWRENIPLQGLVSQSRVIAVGEAVRNACRRSQNEHQITTDYEVRLIEVIKGNVEANSVISVKMPGGVVMERNGSLLNVRPRGVTKMQNGKMYVLFLKNAPGGNDSLTPLGGSQGLYEVRNYGTRVFHLGRAFGLLPPDDGEDRSVFLQQIRNFVRN